MGFFKKFVRALTNPATLIQAGVMFLVGGPVGSLSTIASIGVYAAGTAAVAAVTPTPKMPDLPTYTDFTSQTATSVGGGGGSSVAVMAASRSRMVKQPITERRAVYGEIRVSGPLAYLESTNSDKYLHLVILVASHEVEEMSTFYINEDELTLDENGNATSPSKYSGNVRIKYHLGTADQEADSTLVSESSKWTEDHKLSGIAYIYARLKWNVKAFPQGIPNISVLVKGKKVYDPRTDTTAWSSNPALCIRDYLLSSTYGLGALSTEVNDTSFSTAADICDESVDLADETTESRYTLHGNIESSEVPKAVISKMLTSCGGIIYYTNGEFSIKVAKYQAPTITLDENNVVGTLQVQTKRSARENYNAVKGIFAPPDTNYVPTDYPPILSDVFLAEDNDFRQFLNYDLPYTISSPMAQRLAKIGLFRQRQQVAVTGTFDLKAFQLGIGDTVYLNNDRFGFSNKTFEVAEWTLVFDNNGKLAVSLSLREIAESVYDWDAEEAEFQLDNTILPDATDLQAPGLSVSDELQIFNQKASSVLIASVSSSSPYLDRFEVQAKKSTDTEYIALGISAANRFELIDVEDDVVYNVRARIISSLGITSDFTTVNHQVVGKTAPPADVTNFAGNVVSGNLNLTWTPVADLDLSHYRLRYSSLTTGATYQDASNLTETLGRPTASATVAARQGTYFIKAVDKLGNASINPATIVVLTNIAGIENLNVVATLEEHPDFNGTFDDVVEVDADDYLILDTSTNFDDGTGNFDDGVGFFDGGGGFVDTEGFYYFANSLDLGAIYTSRLTAKLKTSRQDYVNTFDDATGLFDAREGEFDGDVNAFDNTDVELQLRHTNDDPSGSPTWSDWNLFVVGDYTHRAFEFRLRMTSTDSQATPIVQEATVTVDMPDRVESGEDLSSGAGAYAVTFNSAFKAAPAIGITAQNLASGDYYEITSKSATGFTITFKNSGGTAVDRTFDYVAKGYGRLEA